MAQKKLQHAHIYKQRPKIDPFFGTRNVTTLDEDTFGSFLSDQEVALVMFYSPKSPQSHISRTHFVKAAKSAKRDNIAFSAVNCDKEYRLCADENISGLPDFKVYSRGRLMSNHGIMTDYRQILRAVDESEIMPPRPVSKTQFKQ